jgi:hypothetical protein
MNVPSKSLRYAQIPPSLEQAAAAGRDAAGGGGLARCLRMLGRGSGGVDFERSGDGGAAGRRDAAASAALALAMVAASEAEDRAALSALHRSRQQLASSLIFLVLLDLGIFVTSRRIPPECACVPSVCGCEGGRASGGRDREWEEGVEAHKWEKEAGGRCTAIFFCMANILKMT